MASWFDAVKKIAPTIAGALGGPIVGPALRVLSEKLLGRSDGTEAEIAKAIAGDPDAALKLAAAENQFRLEKIRLENDFQTKMAEFGVSLAQTEGADRASARQMQMATRDWIVPALALAVIGSMIGLSVLLALRQVPSENARQVDQVLEILKLSTVMVLSFYFGTSFGSRYKDQLLGKAVDKG